MRFRHTAAVLSLAACLAGGVHAQPAPSPPAKPDLALLNKALLGLETSKTLDTVSLLTITASGQGMNSAFRERVHFVWQKPNKYHSDVTLMNPDGTQGTKYTVVCDGQRVRVAEPSKNEYAVMPRAVFEQDDLGGLGLFGSLVAETVGGSTDGAIHASDLAKSGFKAAGGTVTLADGTVCPVFALTATGPGQTMRFALDPQSATIRQITLSGRQNGLTLALMQTVMVQTPSAPLPASLFGFAPPPGATRVKTLSIGPF